MKKIIVNGKLVFENETLEADLKIENEKIIEIGKNLSREGCEIINANGNFLLPGGIDSHTHFDLDTGITKTADDFYTGSKAALVGGTTTIIDFATQNKNETLQQGLDEWHKKANNKTFCDYGFHMAITDWNENIKQEMKSMVNQGVTTFKMYMAYDNLRLNDEVIFEALKESKKLGSLIGFHCENGDLINAKVKELLRENKTSPYYHSISRPNSIESEAINRVLVIGELTDSPVWVVHLSTKEGLEIIKNKRKIGQKIFVETCPLYLVLDDSSYGNENEDFYKSAKYILSPPLRSEKDKDELWIGLKDHIDFISTDHCSFNLKGQKDFGKNNFSKIPNGAPGVEDRLLIIYTNGVNKNKISINKMVDLLSTTPARIMGLYNKGSLEISKDADIIILNPDYEDIFSAKNQTQNVDYNIFEGMIKKGKIEKVFLRGQEVVSNGKIKLENPNGKYQSRNIINY